MDENLARWIESSIAVYFSAVATALSLTLFVEGIDERSEDTMNQEHAELRVNGPYIKELSKDYWQIHVDINILLVDYMKMSNENAYDINNWGGKFLVAMTTPIPIYRFGDGVDDDDSLIGCLKPRIDFSEPVRLVHFGQVNRVNRIRQAGVDGRFEMFLIT